MRQRGWTVEAWDGAPELAVEALCAEHAALALSGRPHLAWLDSALPHSRHGRWSIVAANPRWMLSARGRHLRHTTGEAASEFDGDPIEVLTAAIVAEQRDWPGPARLELPFAGGAIGYLGFELARHIERLPATTVDDVGAPDLVFGWYDAALVWDGQERRGWLVGLADDVRELRATLGVALESLEPPCPPTVAHATCLQPNMSRASYMARVTAAQRYIETGDIYQVNLSQRLSAPVLTPGIEVYRRLRRVSPAPFAAYLVVPGGVEVLSSSPERLLLSDGDYLETRPIKGTRPRGRDATEDARLVAALRASAKDATEHVMIVDLERNDLGRIAAIGSVAVPEFAALETYANVHHLTSTVVARRRPDVGLAETLRAVLPGGSISGAPKIRALEIIDELEPTVRGVYTGAIGYVSAHGRSDLNVAIRTLTLARGRAHAHVGGAIVHDSNPEAEYRETLDKARGMARALGARLPDEADAARVQLDAG